MDGAQLFDLAHANINILAFTHFAGLKSSTLYSCLGYYLVANFRRLRLAARLEPRYSHEYTSMSMRLDPLQLVSLDGRLEADYPCYNTNISLATCQHKTFFFFCLIPKAGKYHILLSLKHNHCLFSFLLYNVGSLPICGLALWFVASVQPLYCLY